MHTLFDISQSSGTGLEKQYCGPATLSKEILGHLDGDSGGRYWPSTHRTLMWCKWQHSVSQRWGSLQSISKFLQLNRLYWEGWTLCHHGSDTNWCLTTQPSSTILPWKNFLPWTKFVSFSLSCGSSTANHFFCLLVRTNSMGTRLSLRCEMVSLNQWLSDSKTHFLFTFQWI